MVRRRSRSRPRVSPIHSEISSGAATAATRSIQGKPNQIAAISPFTPTELSDCLLQVVLAEIGPQRVDEHQLGIGTLPEQEIADALLAAGADQEVGVGHAGGQQLALEQILVDALRR